VSLVCRFPSFYPAFPTTRRKRFALLIFSILGGFSLAANYTVCDLLQFQPSESRSAPAGMVLFFT
jgi:hypothetical protein